MATKQVTELQVACPHCTVGRIAAYIEKIGHDAEQLQGMKVPHKCPACGKYSQFKLTFHISAVPLPDPSQPRPFGEILRTALGVS